jgi:hypothetical protein
MLRTDLLTLVALLSSQINQKRDKNWTADQT